MNELMPADTKVVVDWYRNCYECSECKTAWDDEWSCKCNDRCPTCNVETQPSHSNDLRRPLTSADYVGAGRLLRTSEALRQTEITAQDAKRYAEAMLERGVHHFELR
jgi:hypothetical protein